MALIPANVILIWTGTHAGIPSGYSRETSLDDKFVKGNLNAQDPNTTGGANSHSHSSPTHNHGISAHVHDLAFGGDNGSNVDSDSGSGGAKRPHTHANVNSGAVASASVSSIAVTYDAIGDNNLPPYYDVVFIKSDGSRGVPDGVVALFDSADVPTNWEVCDGDVSTPNLGNKYLRGATTGANAGGTGGSLTHQHTLNHGAGHDTSHVHSQITSGVINSTQNARTSGNDMVPASHTHTVSLGAASINVANNPTADTSGDSVEPAYRKLLAIQNQNGQDSAPKGVIGLWLGARGDIPAGWQEQTAMNDRYLKIASNTAEIGNTGGSHTHIHGDIAHSHTLSHSTQHGVTISGHSESTRHSGNSSGGSAGNGVHAVTVGNNDATLESVNTSAESVSNEPPFRTTCFIKLTQTADAGFLMNFL